jgi:hypothetical protein
MFDGVFGKTIAAFAAFGILTGCGSPTTLLDVVVTATAAAATAIPLLEAAGVIPAPTATIVLDYVDAVNKAAAQALNEEATADTPAQKAEKIAGYFAAVAVPALGPTVGPEVQAIVNAIIQAVNAFTTELKNPKMIAAAAAGKNYKMDAGASARIRKTTEATSKTIQDWKGAHTK